NSSPTGSRSDGATATSRSMHHEHRTNGRPVSSNGNGELADRFRLQIQRSQDTIDCYFRSSKPQLLMMTSQPVVILRILSAMTARSETVAFFSRFLNLSIF